MPKPTDPFRRPGRTGRARLLRTCDWIEKNVPDSDFNMYFWGSQKENDGHTFRAMQVCRTVGCFLGWATAVPCSNLVFNEWGEICLPYGSHEAQKSADFAGMEYFDLTEEQTRLLFYPRPGHERLSEVCSNARRLAKTGKIR